MQKKRKCKTCGGCGTHWGNYDTNIPCTYCNGTGQEEIKTMFSLKQKRHISEAIQQILRNTNHPELVPEGEITFTLHVSGQEEWSYAEIKNNAAITNPGINPHNEYQDKK